MQTQLANVTSENKLYMYGGVRIKDSGEANSNENAFVNINRFKEQYISDEFYCFDMENETWENLTE